MPMNTGLKGCRCLSSTSAALLQTSAAQKLESGREEFDMVPSINFRSADPRPDLAEDSTLWSLVLSVACEINPQLAANLHGFRCIGTRLKRNKKWGLVMEPILPDAAEEITSDVTDRKDHDDYKTLAQEYLRPYHKELLQLFKRIG